MKISCQSCEAKYTIADEKVRGKVVKIRCKKCNATIVVKGTELSPPASTDYDDAPTRVIDRDELPLASGGVEWTINVTDDDQRTLSTAELVDLYRDGIVDDDTYAWRDGLDDWLPLGQIQELRGVLPRKSAVAPPISIPASSASPLSSSHAAVRRPEARTSSTDLFGAAAFAGSDGDVLTSAAAHPTVASDSSQQLTGARNESSVLFSLSALTTGGNAPRSAPAAEESSSIIDIKNLMGPQASGPKKPAPASRVEDIMNLGGGGIFSPSLAAPVLTADSADSGASTSAELSGRDASSKKSKGMLFGALGVGAAAIAIGAVLLLGRGEGGAQPATETNAATATASADQPAEQAPAQAGEPEQAPDEPAAPTASAEAPADEPPAAEVEPAVAREREKSPATTTTPAKAAEKPAQKAVAAAAKPAPPPKPAAPAPPPPPPKDAPPFDRAAALSALNAASDTAASCKKPDGPTGSGRIAVTFAPSGAVTTAAVEGPPFAGTAVGGCIAARFRNARVPAFSGGTVTVRKSFTIN